ncbi:MAG TPA: GAF domain-containing protein [Candidatus Paraprevotella stercorigallinarum]|jgi:L-methionine (R)-S-oxide reductase|nr:GAF domain-containing protein [Candidatus Paraprevotella stercorigallinarum]
MAEQSFKITENLSKAQKYQNFLVQYEALIENETDLIGIMANTAAALKEAFDFFWVGFYLVKDGQLTIGPFQGSVACYRIKKGRGVCGTAWDKEQTLVVPDVDQFAGHIACSSLSRSEIVVPLFQQKEVIGVLDIDSDQLADFDDTDRIYLEKAMQIMMKTQI